MNRQQVLAALLNPAHPLHNGQRATDDVLVRITSRETGTSVVQYASRGKADYMLERYTRAKYVASTSQPFMVERVEAGPIVRRAS